MEGAAQRGGVLAFTTSRRYGLRREARYHSGFPKHAILRVMLGDRCHVVALRQARAEEPWETGFAAYPALAFGLPAEAILGDVPFEPATNHAMLSLGFLGDEVRNVGRRIEDMLFRSGRAVAREGGSYRRAGFRPVPSAPRDPEGVERMRSLGLVPADPAPRILAGEGTGPSAVRPLPAYAGPMEEPDQDDVRMFGIDAPMRGATDFLLPWVDLNRREIFRAGPAFLAPCHWSGDVAAWYAATGRTGTYRRQAGALFPLFAPALARLPKVALAIDAGRPFEDELLTALKGWLTPADAASFTKGHLRRLRGVSGSLSFDLPHVLSIVARVPVARLPEKPGRWIPLLERCALHALDGFADSLGIPLAQLMPAAPVLPDRLGRIAFPSIRDVVDRCAQTLVSNLLGLADRPDLARRIAARLLFRDMDILAASRLSGRWHRGLVAFEARLPQVSEECAWPALFEPRDYGDLRVLALSTPAQLREEGGRGDDSDGNAGLSHCVGGYARRCFTGECHILSIRRRTETGWERLSTAQIAIPPRRPEEGHVLLTVSQHRGRSNAEPPPEAVEAFDRILDDLGRRIVPIHPDAWTRRDARGFHDGIDWGSPASLAASLEAWRPYLGADCAGLDVDAMRARLAAGADPETAPSPEAPIPAMGLRLV